jgi:hypothetical protein
MPRSNPVQEMVLGHWGITPLSGDSSDPQTALTAFLEELAVKVESL